MRAERIPAASSAAAAAAPRTGHGYDLVERLKTLGVADGDSDGAAGLRMLDAAAGELQRTRSAGAVARPSGPLRQASRDIYQRF
jgi:hypothetical protein